MSQNDSRWSRWRDSNPRPDDYKSPALPDCATPAWKSKVSEIRVVSICRLRRMSDSSQPHHAIQPARLSLPTCVECGAHHRRALCRGGIPHASLRQSRVDFELRPRLPPSETTTTLHHHTVAKSTVRVQVANGTKVSNLARDYSQELLTQGWNTLPGVNGPHEKSTIVYFNPGFKWAAIQIANKIHVRSSLDPSAQRSASRARCVE